MTAISNIRDRSLQLASRLVNQSILLEGVVCGSDTTCHCCRGKRVNGDGSLSGSEPLGQLVAHISRSEKDYSVVWNVCNTVQSAVGEMLQGQEVLMSPGPCRCRSDPIRREVARLFDAAAPAASSTGE